MASSKGSSGGARQLPPKPEITAIKINNQLPRRQLTLIAIAVLLHVLFWSSLTTFVVSLYLIAADTGDDTNTPSEILTIASALVSLAYILLHTIFSLKQRIWKRQRRDLFLVKKTSYVAVRFAVTLCILWLLTSGWNLIIFARRPVCLPAGASLEGWEAGTTCVVGRIGTAISMIALMASFTLFGMLAVVRRPFEAHILKYRYRQLSNPCPTPSGSRRPSPTRSVSFVSAKSRGRASASMHRSTPSTHSIADAEIIDLDSGHLPGTIHAPFPVHPIGFGIFRSSDRPPQIPVAFLQPKRTRSLDSLPSMFSPPRSSAHFPPPIRMSTLERPSGFVPLNNPMQYSASAWKAVHPTLPMPTMPHPLGHILSSSRPVSLASRSNLHLSHNGSIHSFNFYRSGYSRSSVSLTRPNRLSTATPPLPRGSVSWSDRSGSTESNGGRRSRSPEKRSGSPIAGATDRMSAREEEMVQAYRILSSASRTHGQKFGHVRHASAPNTTAGASHSYFYSGRKAKGWKPQLKGQTESWKGTPSSLIKSSSPELLGKVSVGSSAEGGARESLREAFEDALEKQWNITVDPKETKPIRKTRSESPLRSLDILEEGGEKGRATTVSRMPQDLGMKKRMTFDELKNKPLPRIAAL